MNKTYLGSVEILTSNTLKFEKQIPHPARTAGIRDDMLGHARFQGHDVSRATYFLKMAFTAACFLTLICSTTPLFAQEQQGPQTDAPPPVAPKPAHTPQAGSNEKVVVPAGTRVGVVLQNGISTRSAKPGDSVYLQTSFPITVGNRIVIPVGSYLRGELIESKRPGRIKGRGEFRMRLNTLILPTGYTVDLNAAPRSADSGGKETMDEEGKVTGGSDKGKDVGTVASTTATGAAIGAIAGRGKGAGIGAGIGGVAGLAAVLLTRGPEAELPRGSTMDVVLERALMLDSSQIQFNNLGQFQPVVQPPVRRPDEPERPQ